MGGNKESMRQAMKELLGLVGLGPEEEEGKAAAKPAEQPKAEAPKPVVEQPRAEAPKPAAEQPRAEAPKPAPEQPRAEAPKPAAEQPKAEAPKPAPETKAEAERPIVVEPPRPTVWDRPAETDLEETRQRVAATVERGFFSFGRKKEQPREAEKPAVPAAPEPVFTEPTFDAPAFETPGAAQYEAEPFHLPFIRPGATVIAAGATFFGDIRAEGDVEVLGKLKGNLEATGNVRITGKVLGDVKGDGLLLEGGIVQGNITSTSSVTLDEGAMVVGDVLATDISSKGKIKGNLQVARAASLSSTALLAGNVVAATIMMAQGAKVQGAVRIAVDPETSSLFGELEI